MVVTAGAERCTGWLTGVLERSSPQDQRKFICRPVTSCSTSSYHVSSCYGRYDVKLNQI